jgi:hypothetical protein
MPTVRQSLTRLERRLRKRQAAARTWGELGDLHESAGLARLPTPQEVRDELGAALRRVGALRKLLRLVESLDPEGR